MTDLTPHQRLDVARTQLLEYCETLTAGEALHIAGSLTFGIAEMTRCSGHHPDADVREAVSIYADVIRCLLVRIGRTAVTPSPAAVPGWQEFLARIIGELNGIYAQIREAS